KLFARAAFDFAYRIPKFKIKQLGHYYAPELVNRFFDTVTIQKSLSKILMDFSTSFLQIFFGIILLSLYHPVFIAFGLTLLVVLFIIIWVSSNRGMHTSLEESNNKYEMAFWLTELARALPTFKLSGASDLNLKRTDKIVDKYMSSRKKHFRVLLGQYGSIIGLKTLVTAGLLILGALLLINNSITIGQFVASEIIIILILNSSEKLIMSMEAIYDVLTSIEKLGKVTDIPIEEDTTGGIKLDVDQSIQVEVTNMSISKTLDSSKVIEDISFKLPASKSLCITGEAGSGKSAILKVLSTTLDNYEGNILINDVPIQNLDLEEYRKHIGYIFKDEEIFYGTFIENISLGRKSVTEKDVIGIAKAVGLDDLITSFPDGYNHLVLNSERVFSGTDRIRLMVARALVCSPKLLVVEDIFSGIRLEDARQLVNLLYEKCEHATMIIASNNEQIKAKSDFVIEL
ncbi:MAG: ATP-binding cassette domain-containing protein, partial [Bacteroidia bacterium]